MGSKSILSMTCEACGGQLDLDLDNLQKYCSHCGGKILVDPVAFKEVLLEREHTKQVEIAAANEARIIEQAQREWEAEERRHSIRNIMTLVFGVGGMFLFTVCSVAAEIAGPRYDWLYGISFMGFIAAIVAGILGLITLTSKARKRKNKS